MTQITRGQFVLAAVVVTVLVWTVAHTGAGAGGGAATPVPVAAPVLERAPAAAATTPVPRASRAQLVVHVAGAVRHPGVYRLRDGQRVADAVRKAGGGSRRADLDAINLATKVRDGVQILVPRKGTGGGAAAMPSPGGAAGAAGGGGAPAAAAAAAVVDLNTATAEQLETLDGVGPATSAKILEYRAQHGPFRSVDDLEQIPGIGPKKLAAIRTRARV